MTNRPTVTHADLVYPDHATPEIKELMRSKAKRLGLPVPKGAQLWDTHSRQYVSPLGGMMSVPKGNFRINRSFRTR